MLYVKEMMNMKVQISLITIWTNDIGPMKKFYNEVLGFKIIEDLGGYIEFANEGVRFAICLRSVMYTYTNKYQEKVSGQSFELAFPCESIEDLEKTYVSLLEKGAVGICEPKDMPWNQRMALFADPDGNIHEIFTDIM